VKLEGWEILKSATMAWVRQWLVDHVIPAYKFAIKLTAVDYTLHILSLIFSVLVVKNPLFNNYGSLRTTMFPVPVPTATIDRTPLTTAGPPTTGSKLADSQPATRAPLCRAKLSVTSLR